MLGSDDTEKYFLPSIILSVSFHVLLIGGASWIPSMPRAAVLNAPNSLEINVIPQPVVTVMEEDIVVEHLFSDDMAEELVIHDRRPNDRTIQYAKPALASVYSQGAVTEVQPLMHANLAPVYPKIARLRGWEGTVRLEVLVGNNGRPNKIGIQESSGYDVLDQSAAETVKNWKFAPAQTGAMKLSSKIIIPIQFTLKRE